MDRFQHRIWNEAWRDVENTIENKDHFSLMDEIKYDYLRPLVRHFEKGLEVGSGSGRLSTYFALEGIEMTLLDFSDEALRVARNNFNFIGKPISLVKADAFRLPFKENFFDIVFSTGLIEHFSDPIPIMREMMSVLRPGGLFYSDIIPRKFSLLRSLDFMMKIKHKTDEWAEFSFSKSMINRFCKEVGLVNFVVFPFGVFPPKYFPFKWRFHLLLEIERIILYRLKHFWTLFDNTFLAEYLGFGYFLYGYKPC